MGFKDLVVFFSPQTEADDLSDLTEFQRVTAVAGLRGCPVVVFNPDLLAYSHLPQGLDLIRPMIMADFQQCYHLSIHRYKYNPLLTYSIVRRGMEDWQVRDGRAWGLGLGSESSFGMTFVLRAGWCRARVNRRRG